MMIITIQYSGELLCLELLMHCIVFPLARYPLDVARRRMQLGAVLPDSEKCV